MQNLLLLQGGFHLVAFTLPHDDVTAIRHVLNFQPLCHKHGENIIENESRTSDESISFGLGVSESGTNEDDDFVLVGRNLKLLRFSVVNSASQHCFDQLLHSTEHVH